MTNKNTYIGKYINSMKILEILDKGKVKCECECGVKKECNFYDLKRNRIKGCGCKKNTPELKKLASERAISMQKNGILNVGGDFQDKKYRNFKYLFKCLKNSKRKKCLITLQDLEEVWRQQKGQCPYTKINLILPTHTINNKTKSYFYASIDRIDSSKPYTKDNIQYVSRNINYAKNVMSHSDMLNFIKIIAHNN
ncbi:MAG: hypothetical protein RL728_1108, partial [Bacteroidota bacterium]